MKKKEVVYCDKKYEFIEYGNRTRGTFRGLTDESKSWFVQSLERQGLIPVVVNNGGELIGVFKEKKETRCVGNRIQRVIGRIKSFISRRIHRAGN